MNPRFLAPGSYATGDLVPLPSDEAQHLSRVLRLQRGDRVRVFNGAGAEFEAIVEEVSRQQAAVRVGAAVTAAPEARVSVTLVQAVLKGDKMDDVVRDGVMLGVTAIQPVVTRRAETSREALVRAHRRERWSRVAVSSAKQCGRAVVPAIGEPQAFEAALEDVAAGRLPSPALMFVEPSASAHAAPLHPLGSTPPREAALLIGPEGGWDPTEIAQAARACRLVTLGARTLRADVMAVVALSALFTLWNEF
ncbi:MAG TPA: 16S rRNA (uracil(1498)-N(3))-methyltransferase [Vicinamibacterales bacterium]|nr:16S rRNA (uracil(1498)-N(3))-methyltransferase [Vicinamibacterales bacterium]